MEALGEYVKMWLESDEHSQIPALQHWGPLFWDRHREGLKRVPTPSKETTSAGLLCDLGPVTQLLWSISALKWWTASAQRSHPHF